MPTSDIEAPITHHKIQVDAGCRLVIPDRGGADAAGGVAATGKRTDRESRCLLPVYQRYAVRDSTAARRNYVTLPFHGSAVYRH